jgi:hypothetical protein
MARDTVHVWIPDSMLQRTHDHESRYVRDAPLATSASSRGPTNGPATKTKVCTYFGSSFIAERGEDGLTIFHVGTGALPTDTIGDAHQPMSAERYQRQVIEPSRLRPGGR